MAVCVFSSSCPGSAVFEKDGHDQEKNSLSEENQKKKCFSSPDHTAGNKLQFLSVISCSLSGELLLCD